MSELREGSMTLTCMENSADSLAKCKRVYLHNDKSEHINQLSALFQNFLSLSLSSNNE